MHPIEHLRHIARSGGVDPVDLVAEAGHALRGFADDPAGMVAAARRLVARHPAVGPLWWMCSRVLVAPDPVAEVADSVVALDGDPTADVLRAELPDDATVLVVGWPPSAVSALARRGDVEVRAVDDGTGVDLARVLSRVDLDVVDVATQGLGEAAASADVVVIEALAAGPASALCAPGSRAAAAVARAAGVAVWLVAPTGRVLPAPVYAACRAAAVDDREPWETDIDTVPAELVDRAVGPSGVSDPASVLASPDCPVAAELLRGARTPGSHRP